MPVCRGGTERDVCVDIKHMERFFQDIIDRGGEGIILLDPAAMLQPERSLGYLKHKVCVLSTKAANLHSNKEIQGLRSKNCG